jgi:hypothetical protein
LKLQQDELESPAIISTVHWLPCMQK